MRKIDINKAKGHWVTYTEDESLKIKIRPLNILSMNIKPTAKENSQQEIFEWFSYIVIDWSGYIDAENNPILCNNDTKELIFSYDQDIVAFVLDQSAKLRDDLLPKEEIENLKKSVNGEAANQE